MPNTINIIEKKLDKTIIDILEEILGEDLSDIAI